MRKGTMKLVDNVKNFKTALITVFKVTLSHYYINNKKKFRETD